MVMIVFELVVEDPNRDSKKQEADKRSNLANRFFHSGQNLTRDLGKSHRKITEGIFDLSVCLLKR